MTTLHEEYWEIVDAIERNCRVAEWRLGDMHIWPLARQDLFLDLFRNRGGDTAPPPRPFAVRAVGGIATPVTNLWKSRHDLPHWLPWPRRADAVLLGDGVSLDRIDGAWQDRFGEPIAAALEGFGRSTLVIQPGDLTRLPWARPTLAANMVAVRGALTVALSRDPAPDLPDHEGVMELLAQAQISAPSLSKSRLARRVHATAVQAESFERILRRVRPKLAFVVTYYAGLGHAFALACRRNGVLCIDLQHCPQNGTHRAYRWPSPPAGGFTTLPGLFWTWSATEAEQIEHWTTKLDQPWHRAIHGGHSQVAGLHEAEAPTINKWDAAFDAVIDGQPATRNILVALQPIGGQRARWEALAAVIAGAPADWRWWIRRHPASTVEQDADYTCLLSLNGPNVIVGPAASFPLPMLMRRMSALVSLASGAAGEAAEFNVPAFFLSEEASGPFAGLIARGAASVIDVGSLNDAISCLPAAQSCSPNYIPKIADTLRRIERIAEDHAELCARMRGKLLK